VQVTANPAAGYYFVGWSCDLAGSANPQSITMSAARNACANFALIPSGITIRTNPEGRSFTADGVSYTATQTFSWTPGTSHTIATASPQTATGTRYVFAGWSDGGAISHSITTPSGSATYTANFTTQYQLTTAASPPGGGSVSANPSSTDGYYNSGQPVQLTAEAASGAFTGWSGDLTGSANPQTIVMSAPRSVIANFGGCTYAIVPQSASHTASGGAGSVAITAPSGCSWASASNSAWISIASGAAGSGPGSLGYVVLANASSSPRTGSLTIAGLAFTVNQAGALTPAISNLQPSKATAGGPGFSLIVTGSNFMAGSTVLWNGIARPTTFSGVSELRAAIPATDIASPGAALVTVSTPGTGVSAGALFTIMPMANLPPGLSGLSPGRMIRGGQGFTLTVTGANFVPTSKVQWNGQDRPTTFESSNILAAVIPASDIAAAGTVPVSVFTPSPGGGVSGAIGFEVLTGTVITDFSPAMIAPYGRGFLLTIFGANFLGGSSAGPNGEIRRQAGNSPTVLWNGQPLNTVVVTGGELKAEVPAGLVGGSGSAMVSVSGGSGGASNMVPLPFTVTQPTPWLDAISPKSAVPGGSQFTLTIQGKNFVEGSKVLWNGQERQTQFVDSTRIQAVIPEGDIGAVGASEVRVFNPAPGGGESNGQFFSHVQALLYPRLSNAARGNGATDESERTGIAFTNLSASDETMTFTAFDMAGVPLSGPGITNPAQIVIKPGEQSAVIAFQVFGEGLPGSKPIGWFKMESSGSTIPGFFLMYSDTLSLLDGTDVGGTTHTSLIAPEIEPAGFTELNIVNPDVQAAELLFELYGADGQLRAPGVQRTLASGASMAETLSGLFPSVVAAVSDYVRVLSSCGVLMFEYMGKPNQDVAALNGQDADGGATVLYSPQYVVGGGAWRTALSVVNLDARSGVVTFTLRGNDGQALAAPVVRNIPARGKLAITDQNFFLNPGNNLVQGYVEIRSDGVRLMGSVIFGDPGQALFESCLPLVSRLQNDMLFSQLASDQLFYTGLAILNPNSTPVTAHIGVFDERGTLLAYKDEPIAAGGRAINVVTEFFPQLRNEYHSSGYIRVSADQGLASFALFGTKNYTALSAVPAQEIR